MRDPDLMIRLLEEMGREPGGEAFVAPRTSGMSEGEQKTRHHYELLSDAGLAEWRSDSMIRITNFGYDFLNALEQDQEQYWARFRELLGQGKALVEVVNDIITIVNAAGAIGG